MICTPRPLWVCSCTAERRKRRWARSGRAGQWVLPGIPLRGCENRESRVVSAGEGYLIDQGTHAGRPGRFVRQVRHLVRYPVRHHVIDSFGFCGLCGRFPTFPQARTRAPMRALTQARAAARACLPHLPHLPHKRKQDAGPGLCAILCGISRYRTAAPAFARAGHFPIASQKGMEKAI